MSAKASIDFSLSSEDPERFVAAIAITDPALLNHEAEFQVVSAVEVKDKRPVNDEKVLFRKKVSLTSATLTVDVPRSAVQAYTLKGKMIDIQLITRLKVDDGFLFDTKIDAKQELALGLKPPLGSDAKALVDPKDAFSLLTNLKAIPASGQLISVGLLIVGGIVALINLLIGAHDQFVPESATYFYSHYSSDGEGQSPLMAAIAGSGGIGAAVWFMVRRQLRRYMTISLDAMPKQVAYGDIFKAGDLFNARSRVLLENVTLRIVASNVEKGQYKRGSGTDVRTVSFTEPYRAVILYERNVSQIPPNTAVESYFKQHFSFELMYEMLYPPLKVSSSHGLDVHWEIQLIHPEFVDQELVGDSSVFRYTDFLRS